jgi:5-methylcytosine-specific restriction endonuclease McrA
MNRELHERALQCVAKYKRCEKEFVDILEKIDQGKAYLEFGVSSLFRYCVECLRLSEDESYRFIQVTRKAVTVPALKAAIGEGMLTVAKASRIVPVITPATQEEWIGKASELTHRELEREVAKENPKSVRKETIKVLTPTRSELRVSISLALEQKIKRAQEVLKAASLEETLEELVEFVLERKDPIRKAERVATQAPVRPGTCQVKSLPAARQIRRPIPQVIRHQVSLRDQGKCTFRGCKETRWVELHHTMPYSLGGSHSLANLTTLCSGHHRMLHGPAKKR